MTNSVFDPMTELDAEGGASWRGRRATRITAHGREIKMLRPICQTCEDEYGGVKFVPRGWQNTCQHDPYVSYAEVTTTVPRYEDEEDGSKRLVGTETIVKTVPRPNWVSITQDAGVNSGRGPQQALLDGFIFPQQLRSPLWPQGIKRRCQFRDCYAEDIKQYPGVGWFCRDDEAAMVYANDSEETMITAPMGRKAENLQRKQRQELITQAKAAV